MEEKISYKEFICSVLKYNITYILVAIINIAIIPILTRVFSVEEYGFISLFASASAFLSSFFSFGIVNGYVRFFNEPPNGMTLSKLKINCFLMPIIIMLFTFLVVLLFFSEFFSSIILGVIEKNVLVFLFLNVILTYIFLFLPVHYRMQMNIRKYTIVQVTSSFLTKSTVLLATFGTITYFSISGFMTLGLTIFLFAWIFLCKDAIFTDIAGTKNIFLYKNDGFSEVIKFSILAWPVTIVSYAHQFLTQNLINNSLDKTALGIYSALTVFTGIITAVKGGFTTYWSSFIYRYYKYELRKIQQVHEIIMIILCFLLGGMVFFRNIIFLMVGEEFREGKYISIMVVLYSVLYFASETTCYGIYIAKKPYINSLVSVISLLINLIGIHFFSPCYGLLAVGISASVSGMIYFCVCSYFGQKYYKMIQNPVKTIIEIVVMSTIAFLNYLIRNETILYIYVFFLLCFILILNRTIIVDIVKKLIVVRKNRRF